MSVGSQASVRDGDILGGRGRQMEASREGQRQHVEVKVTTDQGRPVKGPNGVVGYMKDHQVVSKKVSYKVEVDYCLILFFIVGITFAACCVFVSTRTFFILCGDCTGNH